MTFIKVKMYLVLLGEGLDILTWFQLSFTEPNLYPSSRNPSPTSADVMAGSRIQVGRLLIEGRSYRLPYSTLREGRLVGCVDTCENSPVSIRRDHGF
jgi:hypothetical protein